MPGVLGKLLHRLGLARQPGGTPDAGEPRIEDHAQPRIETGSTLDTMAALNPETAATYADAVTAEIERAIAACTIGDPGTTSAQALEQIHGLKNAVAQTGSPELLKACEQLRRDASHYEQPAALALRFVAVANAAVLLVKNYRRNLPTNDAGTHA